MDRRQFLGRSAIASAGIVSLPALLAACSTGGAATAAPSGSAPATDAPSGEAPSVSAGAVDFGTPNTSTSLKDFQPFAPSDTVGQKPPVPATFAYFVPEASEYFTGLSDAAQLAADDRGIQYDGLVLSNGDPVKNIDQMNQYLQRGVGGMWIQPEDSAAQGVVIEDAIPEGVCCYFSGHPATIQGMADQYDLGYSQGQGTVDWIKANLGGTATIVSFILDHIEILIPRRQGTNDALAAGGITYDLIEQELQKINADEGFEFASTMLQANPEINVWLGPDDTVLGVNAFLESKKLDPATEVILCSGMAGTEAGLAALESGTTFIREIYGFNNNVIGYAVGALMADWFEGKQIPQLMQGRCIPVKSPEAVAEFKALTDDARKGWELVYAGDYENQGLALWGQISYDTHMNYTANGVGG
jgi:ABC-type sugar transport system substrate-binding protein